MSRRWFVLLFVATGVQAADPAQSYPIDLPPLDQALAAIRQAPAARATMALIGAESANRDRLEAGPHEWALRLEGQVRNVITPDVTRYNEWRGALERPLRLPGKAAIDSEIGSQGVVRAEAAYGDALHETARSLLKRWFVWLREREMRMQWQRHSDSLLKQQQATARRTELGDAPRLELMQAEAATAQAQAALEQARLREIVAATELGASFPAIRRPETLTLSVPQPLAGSISEWREHLLEHNHELMFARSDSLRGRLLANRADVERLPDPVVGVHFGADRSGDERLAGISLSIAIPGAARAANARREVALAEAASQREAATLAKVDAEIATTFATAQAAFTAWQRADEAAQRMTQAAAMVERARTLGEANLAEQLLASRQANEARLLATTARLDALEANYRLSVDAHELWPYSDEAKAVRTN
jgi:outer membrane protein TolC